MSDKKLFPEGLLGKKVGMSQYYAESGEVVPVTVIETGPCFVLSVKDSAKDGYNAVSLGFGEKKVQRLNKPDQGNFQKSGSGAFYHVREVRCDAATLGWNEVGKKIVANEVFSAGQFVDVTGITKGHGFTGVVKRYGMKGQPATRGTHEMRRNIGSIGCRKTPGRVFKNKRMCGLDGNTRVTVQNLKIVAVNPENNVLLVRGAIPGPKGSLVIVKKAMKKLGKIAAS